MKKTPSPRQDRFVIIMAGGRGERFWPVSRQKTPKQLLALLGPRSFLQQAVDRVQPLVPPANVFVITNTAQRAAVRRQLPELPHANIIAEPCGRDTCAAVALGAAVVGARSASAVMAVLPADHVIPDAAKFQRVLGDAFNLAAHTPVIVTIGIQPTEPATGYGYIHLGPPLPASPGASRLRTAFRHAERFVEKPTYEKAVEYLATGQYRWNAGMFVWSFATIADALAQHQPPIAQTCQRWLAIARTPRLAKALAADYPGLKKISVDYALMEHARNVVVAEGTFPWDDLGAWPALARHLKPDADGNCAVGQFLHVDSTRNIVFDARSSRRGLIALVGIRDSIVVQTDDATLVAAQSSAQLIKELVSRLAATELGPRLT
jgi:mannose-1-phosphate guanylyltransferase